MFWSDVILKLGPLVQEEINNYVLRAGAELSAVNKIKYIFWRMRIKDNIAWLFIIWPSFMFCNKWKEEFFWETIQGNIIKDYIAWKVIKKQTLTPASLNIWVFDFIILMLLLQRYWQKLPYFSFKTLIILLIGKSEAFLNGWFCSISTYVCMYIWTYIHTDLYAYT